MAPKELIGRYKLYKSKTKGLLYWLTKTAGGCCDLKTVIKSLTASGTSKAKGDTAELEIRTAELVKLAEVISVADPPVEVPEGVIIIVQDVIKGREECAEWYSAQALEGGGKVERENETHRYFILVLRKILDLLRSARAKLSASSVAPEPSKTKKSRKSKKTKASDDSLGSLFACLDLEDPGDNALGKEPPLQLAETTGGRQKVNFKLEKDEEDSAFEIWCFLQDLNDVRKFVKEVWEEYSRGEISFLAASSITDTAFGLLRCADEDFAKTSTLKSSDWIDIFTYLGLTWFCRGRVMWICPDPDRTSAQPRLPNSDINVVELLCPIATMCLLSYQNDAKFVCNFYKDKSNKGHPEMSSDRGEWHSISGVFGKLAPGLYHIGHCCSSENKLVDEFVQGLADVHHRRNAPTWLTVACQIYLDIYDLLGDHLDHGVKALQDTFEFNRRRAIELRQYQLSGHSMEDVSLALARLDWIAEAAVRFDSTVNDPIDGANDVIPDRQRRVKEEVGCAASVMERSLPAYAGALLTDLKVGTHEAGCVIANHNRFVLSAAHLYRALRAMGVLDLDWHDMDFVLTSFGMKQPLVAKSGAEYDGEAATRRYWLALGVSAQEFAANARRTSKRSINLKELPKVSMTSTLLKALCERQNNWQRHGIGHTKSRMVETVLHALTDETSSSEKATKSTPGIQLKRTYTPCQLLSTFKKRLLHDEPMLNFDFSSFMLSCARVLETVAAAVEPHTGMTAERSTSGMHLNLVARILGSSASSKMVAETASILRGHIEVQGKTNIIKAYNQSSGRIPKNLRPKIQHDQEQIRARCEMMCTMLDYSQTKYSFSGSTFAAYHPGIKPEVCCGDGSCKHKYKGAETDPEGVEADGSKRIAFFGSALPKVIVDSSIAMVQKNPASYFKSRIRLVDHSFKEYAHGDITEVVLREQVRKLMGLELLRTERPDPFDAMAGEGMRGWIYVVRPGSDKYDLLFASLKEVSDPEMKRFYEGVPYGTVMTIAVSMLSALWHVKVDRDVATGSPSSNETLHK